MRQRGWPCFDDSTDLLCMNRALCCFLLKIMDGVKTSQSSVQNLTFTHSRHRPFGAASRVFLRWPRPRNRRSLQALNKQLDMLDQFMAGCMSSLWQLWWEMVGGNGQGSKCVKSTHEDVNLQMYPAFASFP